jgi:hypothetical protein
LYCHRGVAGQNWWPAFAMGVIAAELTT